MDDYTPEAGSDEFKRFALLLVLQILTERTVRTKSQVYGGMHAPTVLLKKAFCKHDDTQIYKRNARFAKFCNETEIAEYFDTVRRLLTRPPNERPEYSIQNPSTSKKTRRMIQEWYEDNQELVEKKREAIHSLVVTAFEVIWDIHSGLDKDAVVENFHGDWRIVEAMENDEYLVNALFQYDQICNMYAVVATKKGAACGLDYIAKNRLLDDEESSYRWDIVSCKIHTTMPAVSLPHRQHLAAIENQIQQQEEQLDHVVDHIEMSACVDTICNQELRPNIDHSRVCEAALLRLEFLMDKRKYIKVQDLVQENAAELIPLVMSRHEHNKVIQGCGLTLSVCQQSGLAKTLYRAALNVEECICAAMMNFPDELQFPRLGLQVLLVLQECAGNDDSSLQSWYLKMIDANALDALTTVLNIHATQYSIVKRSMTLLGNILGGSDNVSDRQNLVAHDDLCSAINNASEMRSIVKKAYYTQKEEQPDKAEEELKPLRKRVVSLTKRLRQQHKAPAES